MATRKAAAATAGNSSAAEAAVETSPSGYWTVTVNRLMQDVFDADFVPGVEYRADQAVVDALGDAVETKTPIASVIRADAVAD